MRRLSMVFGAALVALGAYLVMMAYAFSVFAGFDGTTEPGWPETLRRMTSDGADPLGFGVLLIGVGLWLALSKPKPDA